ncbi:hypothetical protein V490_02366, partial [Pseudogymnoascus sp. VKM F-3557]
MDGNSPAQDQSAATLFVSWKSESWQRQITDDKYDGESGINSVQNGILLRSNVHDLFDTFYIAVNPDRDYKTYCFLNDPTLDNLITFRDTNTVNKYQPCRALLKHHFKMCVLLNMKGRTVYPVWDEDILPGCDDMTEVSRSEEGKLRLEAILAINTGNILVTLNNVLSLMHRSVALSALREQRNLGALSWHLLSSAEHIQRNTHAVWQLGGAGDVGGCLGGGEVGDRRGEALEAYAGGAQAGVDGDGGGRGGGDLDAEG